MKSKRFNPRHMPFYAAILRGEDTHDFTHLNGQMLSPCEVRVRILHCRKTLRCNFHGQLDPDSETDEDAGAKAIDSY
jgi:hypothetical protein